MPAGITFKVGDILQSQAEALVNTVNCVGVMGRGVALQFKRAHPDNFKAYAAACARGEVQPGRMFVFATGKLTPPRYIINFPTKRHWRGRSRIEDVESGLRALVEEIRARGVHSIAIPPLGSGMGGLDWREVRRRIEDALTPLTGVQVVIYEPTGAPEPSRRSTGTPVPEMTPGRAVLVELVGRYLGGLLDPFITLLELHKLMYFMQEAGEPLRLRFREAPYGPYAENLRHVLKTVEGHLLTGYADGDAPGNALALVPGAAGDANAYLAGHPETQARFQRVASLVDGFESPSGLELLATTHWVICHQGAAPNEVAARFYSWGAGKKQFTERQIGIAVRALASHGWVGAEWARPGA